MKQNSRLSLALHTLAHMASDPTRSLTSSDIAEHIGTNPVVVRRVLGKLREASILKSQKGHAGGWWLARMPDEITLADVYLALNERLIMNTDEAPTTTCSVEHSLHEQVTGLLKEVEESLVQKLANIPMSKIKGNQG
ncbi:MAG: Rrf2 family transcriptional regulator [Pseudomonadota bacterium]